MIEASPHVRPVFPDPDATPEELAELEMRRLGVVIQCMRGGQYKRWGKLVSDEAAAELHLRDSPGWEKIHENAKRLRLSIERTVTR